MIWAVFDRFELLGAHKANSLNLPATRFISLLLFGKDPIYPILGIVMRHARAQTSVLLAIQSIANFLEIHEWHNN